MLNKDMFQRIDVVVYHVVRCRSVGMYLAYILRRGRCAVSVGAMCGMQAFGLGVRRMIPRQFSGYRYRHSHSFGIQMSNGSFGSTLFGADDGRYMSDLRHRFLRFRFSLLVCPCHDDEHQQYRTDEFNQSLHLFPFEGAKVGIYFNI